MIRKSLFMFLLALVFVSTACKDDDPVQDSNFDVLSEYLVANNLDLDDVLTDWIVGAPAEADLNTFLSTYQVMDIRSADVFNAGHIEGAINSSLGTIVDDAEGITKPIIVACYTGQSAGHAVVALRLSGYTDARVLKFGMSGWNSTTSASWANSTGDVAVGHNMWKAGTNATATESTFSAPVFTSTASEGAAMLEERVQVMLANGFKGIANADVLGNPAGYFINNYWAATDTEHYGFIDGAYRINSLKLEDGSMNKLDPSKTCVTYCWTGQTSSMITAYLNVLGFDAKSLKFGANGMIYSVLESHKYATPTTDLPLVVTAN